MTSPTSREPLDRTIHVPDEAALERLAAALAAVLPPRVVIALWGDLGAGKTTLVKWVAAAVGIDPADVVSPTFGLIHEHPMPAGGRVIVHADMYRLSGVAELAETGWEDALSGAGWVFVEWPERITAALPDERIDVAIAIDSPTARTLTFRGHGDRPQAAVAALVSP